MARTLRIGVDTGGTFTDLLAARPDGRLQALKLNTSAADPATAVLDGCDIFLAARDQSSGPQQIKSGPLQINVPAGTPPRVEVTHGTTVATNALLERRGGPVVLLTTAGFEDLLQLGRQARPDLYALHPVAAPPLCPPELCLGVLERVAADGQILTALTAEEISRVREQVAALSPRAIAVVLLHSYCRDDHERALQEALRPLGRHVSRSSHVLPAHREYERAVATVVDAYVEPLVGSYLRRIEAALSRHAGTSLRVMQSAGGASAAAEVAGTPVRTILSGPAAGIIGAQAIAASSGARQVITFDMGGTSTDVCLIDGEPMVSSEVQVAGLPLSIPMLAVHTVGAGGGSIAWIDQGGALQVGPRSAGAQPGPACFGRGGTLPTLTDADLLLGRLHGARFCEGRVRLDEAAAARAFATLSGSPLEAAVGVVQVACAVVARAVRTISVNRGYDPADFTLLSYGGAGGLHAVELAHELGIRRILIPPSPGLLCAYGALCAPVVREQGRTLLREASLAQAQGTVAEVLRQLTQQVEQDLLREGGGQRPAQLQWYAELRYHGQSFELTLPGVGDGGPGDADTDLVVRFHKAHQARYGFTLGQRRVDLVALRVRGTVPSAAPSPIQLSRVTAPVAGGPKLGETRLICPSEGTGRSHEAPVLDRAALRPGERLRGPALLVEYSGTTVLPGGWGAVVDDYGSLHLEG